MSTQTQQKQAQPKQNQQAQNQANAEKSNPFRSFFVNKKKAIEAYVNEGLKKKYPGFAEELIANFVHTISEDKRKENNLKSASSDSMVKAIYFCARKGLSLSQKQVHLALFKGALTPIIGINGYRELIRRNPRILKVGVYVVKQKDEFSVKLGTNADIHHVPNIFEDSPIIGSYAYAYFRDGGGYLPIICNKKELDEARNKSKSSWAKILWEENPESMSKVLPLRKLGKELGVDVEDDGVNPSDSVNENKAYSDNVVPFVPSANYAPQSAPDYDYDYEGHPS